MPLQFGKRRENYEEEILALALAAVLVVTGSTACGSKNDAKTDNGKVYRTVDEIKKSGTIKLVYSATRTHSVT